MEASVTNYSTTYGGKLSQVIYIIFVQQAMEGSEAIDEVGGLYDAQYDQAGF